MSIFVINLVLLMTIKTKLKQERKANTVSVFLIQYYHTHKYIYLKKKDGSNFVRINEFSTVLILHSLMYAFYFH